MLAPLTQGQRKSLDLATETYARQAVPVAGYLLGRGIDAGIAHTFRLGCVAEPLPGHEQFKTRLTIPYLTPSGPVDIRFRAVHGEQPKYLSRPGSHPNLFNVGALRRPEPYIAICEGEIDAITMDALVGVPAVGVPGASNWQRFWTKLFWDYDRVFVLCDGDDAGRQFGKTLARAIDSAVVIHLPAGQDVNALYMTQGADVLRKMMGV